MSRIAVFSWITAITATLGSLYFSEVMGFIPCNLCWYQRILMYPLVFILGVAVYSNDQKVSKYVLPFSIVGIIISAYHYLHQKVPALQKIETCTSGVPCSGEYINLLGFITIPLLAFMAFTIITLLMFITLKQAR